MSFENISLVYHPSTKLVRTNNSDQKFFQNLSKLVDKYSSKISKKEKEYVLDNIWKTSQFYRAIKAYK